jgi:hypothetical protein
MTETSIAPAKAGTPNLNKALSQLQGELPKVTKTKEGKVEGESKNSGKSFSYTYKYADLADVVAEVGPLLAKFGLAFHCAPTIDPANRNMMILAWSLLHESGEEKTGEWPLGPVSQKPQTLGSMITYGRRYSFSAAINIVVEDDDDGQRAQNDHGSRQSAGDVWENAKPAPARQNGGNGGASSRPAQPVAAAPAAVPDAPEDIDPAAQAYADEAHGAVTLNEIEDIQRRAREDSKGSKLLALVRNPAAGENGKPGQLALYIDWRRKAVKEGDDALAGLIEAATEQGVSDIDGWFRTVMNTEINAATASQLRTALKTLREKTPVAV